MRGFLLWRPCKIDVWNKFALDSFLIAHGDTRIWNFSKIKYWTRTRKFARTTKEIYDVYVIITRQKDINPRKKYLQDAVHKKMT